MPKSTNKTNSTAGNQNAITISGSQDPGSPATVIVAKNKFNISGSIEGDKLRMTPNSNREHLDVPHMNKFMLHDGTSESDMTVENF